MAYAFPGWAPSVFAGFPSGVSLVGFVELIDGTGEEPKQCSGSAATDPEAPLMVGTVRPCRAFVVRFETSPRPSGPSQQMYCIQHA